MPIEKVDYPFGTPTTEDAFRVRTDDGVLFVKIVRSFRHWPLIHTLPPALAQQAADSPLWHYEADVYASDVGDVLPDGMRLPRVVAVADLGDDRTWSHPLLAPHHGGILLRSTFTALPLTRLHEPPSGDLAALFRQRVALTSHLCEVSATVISC